MNELNAPLDGENGAGSKPKARTVARMGFAQWLFVTAFVVVLMLLLASAVFHFSAAWGHVIKTAIPLLVLYGVALIYFTQRRNAKAVQNKLEKLDQHIKRPSNN